MPDKTTGTSRQIGSQYSLGHNRFYDMTALNQAIKVDQQGGKKKRKSKASKSPKRKTSRKSNKKTSSKRKAKK
jgi:hypothetical protein